MKNKKLGFVERASRAIMHKSTKDLSQLLDPNDMKRMSRVLQADRLLIEYRSDTNTAKALIKYWTALGEPYSLSSAYKDMNYAKRIFGSIRLNNKDYERYMLREMIYSWIKIWEGEPGKENSLNAAVKNLIVLGRLDKQDEESIDTSMLGKHTIVMTDDITEIGITRDPRTKEYTDSLLAEYYTAEQLQELNDRFKNEIFQDIDFEIIPDDDDK